MEKIILEKLPGWEHLNGLGRRYYELVQQGHGKTVEERCEEQIKIVNEFISGVYPFLIKISNDLLNGKHILLTKTGYKFLSLNWVEHISNINYSPFDLANEAVIGVIKSFNRYNPEKGAVSTFVDFVATNAMYNYGLNHYNIVRAPLNMQGYFKKISIEEVFENQLDKIKHRSCFSKDGLYYTYLTQKQNPLFIENSYEYVLLKIEEDIDLDERLETKILETKLKNILESKLNERERSILFNLIEREDTLKKIGTNLGLSAERVRQIGKSAIKKLKKHAIKEFQIHNSS